MHKVSVRNTCRTLHLSRGSVRRGPAIIIGGSGHGSRGSGGTPYGGRVRGKSCDGVAIVAGARRVAAVHVSAVPLDGRLATGRTIQSHSGVVSPWI